MITRAEALTVLGLGVSPTEKEINKAYRQKCLEYHPDKNPDSTAEEMFKRINTAHKFLIDALTKQEEIDSFTSAAAYMFTSDFGQAFFAAQGQPDSRAKRNVPGHGWYIDDEFSNKHAKLNNQDFRRYCQPSIIFWDVGSSHRSISLPMKDNSEFTHQMLKKIWEAAPQWAPTSRLNFLNCVEQCVAFQLPKDEKAYRAIIELTFSEYQISYELQTELKILLGIEQSNYQFSM